MGLTDRVCQLTDTHCHLYSEAFDSDREETMTRSAEAGVKFIYLPAIDSSAHGAMLQCEREYPPCKAMMGLHPCSVNANYKYELNIVEEWLNKRPFAAIGEIGLDYYWSTEFAEQQAEAFRTQMQWALDKKMPVVIHTRNAMPETISIVKPFAGAGLRGIFHCFGGTEEEAMQIVDMNFYLGTGGILTYKKSSLPQAIANISLHHLVLETDAPYLPPVPYRGKRNESSYLPLVAQKLAELKGVSVEEVADITTRNAEIIFNSLV